MMMVGGGARVGYALFPSKLGSIAHRHIHSHGKDKGGVWEAKPITTLTCNSLARHTAPTAPHHTTPLQPSPQHTEGPSTVQRYSTALQHSGSNYTHSTAQHSG